MSYRESEIQQACIRWFRYQYPQYAKVLIHVPNEGKRTSKVVYGKMGSKVICTGGARLIAEGMVPGAADLILLVPRNGHGSLCIEMKSEDGKLRQSQKEWSVEVINAGNSYVVCHSVEEFITAVNSYLN